jgi:outer membrane cobalamin receptor
MIRIHGGMSSQVLVLLDGQRLNNPQTGEVDLNMIPLESIEKIDIIRHGNTAVYGSNAFDGIVNFHTRKISPKSSIDIKSYAGSFSTAGGDAVLDLNIRSAELFTDYHQDYSAQDFQYRHEGERFTRQNAWYRNQKIFSRLSYQSLSHELNLLVNYHQGRQGLPSSFYEEILNYNAGSDFTFTTFQINDRWLIHPRLYLRTLIGYNRLNQYFDNEEDPSPFTRYQSTQVNNLGEIKSELFFLFNSAVTLRTGIDVLQEQLKSENLLYPQYSIGQKKRNTFSMFGSSEWSVTFLNRIFKANNWRAALRYEKYFALPGSFYPFFGFSFFPYYFSYISISGNWARSIRYPDFNSLFWKGDARSHGNPELLPEKKDQWNFSIRTTWSDRFLPSLSTNIYWEEINDLIFWHRNVQGIWEPRNEARVSKWGTDIQLEQTLISGRLQYQLCYSYIQALNKSDEPNRKDKMIVFIPHNSISSLLRSQLGAFQFTLLYRYVSERQVTAANTGTPLNPYTIWDLLASYNWEIANFRLELGGAIKNFTGSDYELIRGYPMPGREYLLSLAVKFHSN